MGTCARQLDRGVAGCARSIRGRFIVRPDRDCRWAHLVGPEHRVVDLTSFSIGALIYSICSAFFAFAIGGWVAGKVAGILHSEPGMIHGAFCWLIALPILVAAAGLGAGSSYGGWYGGLTGAPAWGSAASAPFVRPDAPSANATAEEITAFRTQQAEYTAQVRKWNEETPRAVRNRRPGCRYGTLARADRQRAGRLDGLRRTDELHALSDTQSTIPPTGLVRSFNNVQLVH